MTHKFLYIPSSRKSIMPYLTTTVSFEKSFGEIQGLLLKFGSEDLLTRTTPTVDPKYKKPCTKYSIAFVQKGNRFLIEFPIVCILHGRNLSEPRINMNVSGRIMFNKVKALLVDVEMEFLSFEQAMMPFQLITDGSGATTTIQEFVDQHRAEINRGVSETQFLLGKV